MAFSHPVAHAFSAYASVCVWACARTCEHASLHVKSVQLFSIRPFAFHLSWHSKWPLIRGFRDILQEESFNIWSHSYLFFVVNNTKIQWLAMWRYGFYNINNSALRALFSSLNHRITLWFKVLIVNVFPKYSPWLILHRIIGIVTGIWPKLFLFTFGFTRTLFSLDVLRHP